MPQIDCNQHMACCLIISIYIMAQARKYLEICWKKTFSHFAWFSNHFFLSRYCIWAVGLNRRARCHRWNGDTCLIIWLKFIWGQRQTNKFILMLILVWLGLNVGSNEGISNQGAVAILTTDIHTLGIPIPKKVPAKNLQTSMSIMSLIRPCEYNGMFFNRRSVANRDRGLSAYVCQRLTGMAAKRNDKSESIN